MSDDQHATSPAPEDTGSGSGAGSSQPTVQIRTAGAIPSRPNTGNSGSSDFGEAWSPTADASSLAQQMVAQSGTNRPNGPAALQPPPGAQTSGKVTPSSSSD
jgi:hypothetical protein